MAGKVRHLVNRSGRYHARLVVPKDLRGIVGKSELRAPLGGEYRQALKLLPSAVAQLQNQIGEAERKSGQISDIPRYPMAADQMAHAHYTRRLAFDDELRNDWRYAMIEIDDLLVHRLREAIAGRAQTEELESLVGREVERFRKAGNFDAPKGSDEWRKIARAICSAEYEALERVYERDEGDFTGTLSNPMLVNAEPPPEPSKRVSIKQLWIDYVTTRKNAGFMKDGGRRQGAAIENLHKFMKHDDAAKIAKKDVLAWRDHLMQTLSAKIVSDVYLSTVRTLFQWAVDNDKLPENPAVSVKQPKPRKIFNRERGYTDAEALKLLKASRVYAAKPDEFGNVRESETMVQTKRWVPLLCAFTGARVSEITQLRKEDLRQVDGGWVARITPDAGTVKSGGYRDVPLHLQIIEEGFVSVPTNAPSGPLFHNSTDPQKFEAAARIVSNRLSVWLRNQKLVPEDVQPSHGWRYRFKTQCREHGIADGTYDAIQGHSGKTASANYGDVPLKTKKAAIDKFPDYDFK
jgi:integrase